MNALTNENSLADEHMFTTLSTLVRKISVQKKRYLIVDTVGFIDGLPLYVIDAFRSTYEEIYMADVVLVLVDASDDIPEMLRKLNVVTSQIKQYANKFSGNNNVDKKMVYVLTKVDCADELKLQQVSNLIEQDYHARPVLISVHRGVGINELIEHIDACVGKG
jgi:GTP-binding protein HflX